MDSHSNLGAGRPIAFQQQTAAMILCCMCGISIESNPANMCSACLQSRVDITEGIPKQITIFWCRNCGRYQRPPWVVAELESKEMLALCLKKIKGLNKEVKLIDAAFIWTEPHSRRIKVKLTVQKEIFNGVIMQQAFVVEFIVANMQCTDCQASFTEHTWQACVQLRQHRKHKRTMLMLEQMLIKHNVCPDVMQIKEVSHGLDFYFKTTSQSKKLADFIKASLPVRLNQGKKLISEDLNSNVQKNKYNYLIEIAPASKDDILILSKKMVNQLGLVSNTMLCHRVSNSIHVIDPVTLKTAEINSDRYFVDAPRIVLSADRLIEFIVIDINITGDDDYSQRDQLSHQQRRGRGLAAHNKQTSFNQKICLAEAVIARVSDFGVNDNQITCMTHLGRALKPGDTVLGYDIAQSHFTDLVYCKSGQLPEAILVRKSYPKTKKRVERRQWKLRRLDKEQGDRAPRKHEIEQAEREFEEFMQEVEEDPELLAHVNLYRKFKTPQEEEEHKRRMASLQGVAGDDDDDNDDDLPDLMNSIVLNDDDDDVPFDPFGAPDAGNADDDYGDFDDDDDDGYDMSAEQQQQPMRKTGRGVRNQAGDVPTKEGGFDDDYTPFIE